MGELEGYRQAIDRLDAQLLEIVGRRLAVCQDVARYKARHGMPVLQPERAAQVVARAVRLGADHGLDAHFVEALYGLIMGEACRLEDQIVANCDTSLPSSLKDFDQAAASREPGAMP